MQQQNYNASVQVVVGWCTEDGHFTAWKRRFLGSTSDRLLGEVVVPDVEARLVQMTGINEGVGGTVVGE